jgi:aspartyl-tRNA(Asn)/glutamyl-tRNA(Gln) amidotransferase subunit A
MVPVALGSDTGGSIRQPAAFCGAVGFKPTYGRVSRWGLVAFASSLDQIGPIATDVRDAALVTEVIAGTDAHDGTCADRPAPDLTTELETPVAGLRVGLVSHAAAQGNHAGVTEAVRRAADRLADAGAEIVDVDLPLTDHAIAAYYIVAPAEASSNLSRFDGVRYGRRADLGPADDLRELYVRSRTEGFGPEVRRRIMLGTYVLSSGYHDRYYARALRVRRRIKQDYDRALASGGGCHALLTPTTPGPAFGLGEKLDDPLALYLEDVYTVGVSLAGLPAITLPGGRVDEGGSPLPVGVQLVGHAFDESGLLRVARTLEKALGTVPA